MAFKQAQSIAMSCCYRKRPRSFEDAQDLAAERDIHFYACPFSKVEYHYHLTSGRNGRSKTAIRRAAERLKGLGPV